MYVFVISSSKERVSPHGSSEGYCGEFETVSTHFWRGKRYRASPTARAAIPARIGHTSAPPVGGRNGGTGGVPVATIVVVVMSAMNVLMSRIDVQEH
jgi:hypothetical protein